MNKDLRELFYLTALNLTLCFYAVVNGHVWPMYIGMSLMIGFLCVLLWAKQMVFEAQSEVYQLQKELIEKLERRGADG